MRLHRMTVPVLMIALGLLSACGKANASDGIASANGAKAEPKASASSNADRTEQFRQFAQCMRDHGVDVPDPGAGGGPGGGGGVFVPGEGGGGGARGFDRSNPNFEAAMTACRSLLPNGGQPPKLSAEQIEQFRQFAQCMRDHGVDVPDPNPDGTLTFGQGRGLGQVDRNDPTVQAAFTACRDKMPNFRQGRGPGGTT